MFSSSDSSDSDNNNKRSDIIVMESMHRKAKRSSPPRHTIKRVPARVPKRSVSPMANHPTFVRLKREREIEEKETEEDSSYPTSKKYRSETFARRFREMSLSDHSTGVSLYTNPVTMPLFSGFTLDLGSDDCDDGGYSESDDEDNNEDTNFGSEDNNNNNSEDNNFNGNGQNGRGACIVYEEDPYTIHQFEKFQKRHQHNLSSSPLHRMASTVSTLDGTVTTVTIAEDKTCSTVVTALDDDEDDENDDENICDTRQSSSSCSSSSSSSNSSCSGNGSCAGSDK